MKFNTTGYHNSAFEAENLKFLRLAQALSDQPFRSKTFFRLHERYVQANEGYLIVQSKNLCSQRPPRPRVKDGFY